MLPNRRLLVAVIKYTNATQPPNKLPNNRYLEFMHREIRSVNAKPYTIVYIAGSPTSILLASAIRRCYFDRNLMNDMSPPSGERNQPGLMMMATNRCGIVEIKRRTSAVSATSCKPFCDFGGKCLWIMCWPFVHCNDLSYLRNDDSITVVLLVFEGQTDWDDVNSTAHQPHELAMPRVQVLSSMEQLSGVIMTLSLRGRSELHFHVCSASMICPSKSVS